MSDIREFRVAYDKTADVLYISTPYQPGEGGREDKLGIVWRYGSNGQPLGCVVADFAEYWYPRRRIRLAREIAKNLDLPEPQVVRILEHAAG
jgi:hypothetical protein